MNKNTSEEKTVVDDDVQTFTTNLLQREGQAIFTDEYIAARFLVLPSATLTATTTLEVKLKYHLDVRPISLHRQDLSTVPGDREFAQIDLYRESDHVSHHSLKYDDLSSGNEKKGDLHVNLSDLDEGYHTLTIRAWCRKTAKVKVCWNGICDSAIKSRPAKAEVDIFVAGDHRHDFILSGNGWQEQEYPIRTSNINLRDSKDHTVGNG